MQIIGLRDILKYGLLLIFVTGNDFTAFYYLPHSN